MDSALESQGRKVSDLAALRNLDPAMKHCQAPRSVSILSERITPSLLAAPPKRGSMLASDNMGGHDGFKFGSQEIFPATLIT